MKYDETDNKFIINTRNSMIAISEKDSDSWKYIEYIDPQEEMLKQLIPSEVLKQIEN